MRSSNNQRTVCRTREQSLEDTEFDDSFLHSDQAAGLKIQGAVVEANHDRFSQRLNLKWFACGVERRSKIEAQLTVVCVDTVYIRVVFLCIGFCLFLI